MAVITFKGWFMAAKKQAFPSECCGSCKYAHFTDAQTECYANPPTLIVDSDDGLVYVRSAIVLDGDPACHLFKGKLN